MSGTRMYGIVSVIILSIIGIYDIIINQHYLIAAIAVGYMALMNCIFYNNKN